MQVVQLLGPSYFLVSEVCDLAFPKLCGLPLHLPGAQLLWGGCGISAELGLKAGKEGQVKSNKMSHLS